MKTDLCFPHDFAPRAYPCNEDEFLTLRLLVVRVRDTNIGVGSLGGIQFLLKLKQATSACSSDAQFIRAVVLGTRKSVRNRKLQKKNICEPHSL
jgi:hypothetical protein